jgi:hypothetical protein
MRRFLGVIGGIALGLTASQFPEYAQQYTQRLGGHVDELKAITEKFDRDATAEGLSRDEAFARYDATSDGFIQGQGLSMEQTFVRYEDLRSKLADIQDAGPIDRLRYLPDYLDSEIGQRTLQNFVPAVPVTIEGFVYAAIGVLLGYTLVSIIVGLFAMPFRRRRPYYR